MPTKQQYEALEQEYIASLNPRKRDKALLCQSMFDMIWEVLHEPTAARVGTPQFRWWVRKMFVLSYPSGALTDAELASIGGDPETRAELPVVLHQDRPVALKEQIYEILCYCHHLSNHGGRDRTTAAVREHYSWIPKDLIARFVKVCPTCIYKKTRNPDVIAPLNEDVSLVKLEAKDREQDLIAEVENLPPPRFDSNVSTLGRTVPLAVYDVPGISSKAQSSGSLQPWPPSAGPASFPGESPGLIAERTTASSSSYVLAAKPIAMRVTIPLSGHVPGALCELPPLRELGDIGSAFSNGHHLAGVPLVLPSLFEIPGQPACSDFMGHSQYNRPDPFAGFSSAEYSASTLDYVPQIDPLLLQDGNDDRTRPTPAEDSLDDHVAGIPDASPTQVRTSGDLTSFLHASDPLETALTSATQSDSVDTRFLRRLDIASILNTPRTSVPEPKAVLSWTPSRRIPPFSSLVTGSLADPLVHEDVFYAGSPVLSVSHAVSFERLTVLTRPDGWDIDAGYE